MVECAACRCSDSCTGGLDPGCGDCLHKDLPLDKQLHLPRVWARAPAQLLVGSAGAGEDAGRAPVPGTGGDLGRGCACAAEQDARASQQLLEPWLARGPPQPGEQYGVKGLMCCTWWSLTECSPGAAVAAAAEAGNGAAQPLLLGTSLAAATAWVALLQRGHMLAARMQRPAPSWLGVALTDT